MMCGRFGFFELRYFLDQLRQLELPFEEEEHYRFMPGYNIAPDSTITVLLGDEGVNVLANAHWGLVPHWAETIPKIRPVNARSESLGTKPYFRHMLDRRHCLIPASGFYEWSAARDASPKSSAMRDANVNKQPWYIHRADKRPMALAGLWDRWQPKDERESPLISCTIITTQANAEMQSIHERMPVILEQESWQEWLKANGKAATYLLRPAADGIIESYRVSRKINNPRYIRKDCIEPFNDH